MYESTALVFQRYEVMDLDYVTEAELANGRLAMVGWVAAIGAYVTTGQIIPGIF